MWLLNTQSLNLHYFEGGDTPQYAILSHRWQGQEVSFQDMQQGIGSSRAESWRKIQNCCKEASKKDLDWVWIDSCCIDKSSSAELSEAINSMFVWYRKAAVCLIYLFDVSARDPTPDESLQKSEWFKRGWTLQELLAPRQLEFFDMAWTSIGCKPDLLAVISLATNIPERYLYAFRAASVAERFSWMANRETKRAEDMSYSMMGLFNVNMPLLYGEGAQKAFHRLQLEIIQSNNDDSIFAWDRTPPLPPWTSSGRISILAPTVVRFAEARDIVIPSSSTDERPYFMTNVGLRVDLRLYPAKDAPGKCWLAPLNCFKLSSSGEEDIALYLRRDVRSPNIYVCEGLRFLDPEDFDYKDVTVQKCYIRCERPLY